MAARLNISTKAPVGWHVTLADGVEIIYTYDDKLRTVEVKRGGLRRPSVAE